MKLNKDGSFWSWDELSRETDLRIMGLQKQYKERGLSIWGTVSCQRCGACCYKFKIPHVKEEQYRPCPYQSKANGGASCELQGKKKPWGCKRYGCWNKRFKMGTDAERLQLMRIAIDILGTKNQNDLLELIVESEGE